MPHLPELARLRFGAFDFDPATRELRRQGIPVRLQPQPAQVLALLLDSPGELVTRDTLRAAIWGSETSVDFDRGLNFCIAQIRLALGDSSDSPVYVKTLPKRGYQFIAPVSPPPAPLPAPPAPSRRRYAILALVVLAVAAFLFARPWNFLAPARPAPLRIAVARFDNQTADPDFTRFTDALTDAVIGELTTSGGDRFAVIGNAAILRQPVTLRDLLAIHAALQVDLILLGSVQRTQQTIQVLVQLIGLPSQAHLKVTRVRTTAPDPLSAQSALAQQILHDLQPTLLRQASLTPSAKP